MGIEVASRGRKTAGCLQEYELVEQELPYYRKNRDKRIDRILSGEAPSKMVVSLQREKMNSLQKILKKQSIPCQILGEVKGNRLVICHEEKKVIDLPLNKLPEAWRNSIPPGDWEKGKFQHNSSIYWGYLSSN